MVIFHSYVKLPEGKGRELMSLERYKEPLDDHLGPFHRLKMWKYPEISMKRMMDDEIPR